MQLNTSFALGTMPRPIGGANRTVPTAMDENDLNSYRALLAKSDDREHTLLGHDTH